MQVLTNKESVAVCYPLFCLPLDNAAVIKTPCDCCQLRFG